MLDSESRAQAKLVLRLFARRDLPEATGEKREVVPSGVVTPRKALNVAGSALTVNESEISAFHRGLSAADKFNDPV
jgi:hypothetical protein